MSTINIKCQQCGHEDDLTYFLSSKKMPKKNTFQSTVPSTRFKYIPALLGYLANRYEKVHSLEPHITVFESYVSPNAGELVREKFKINCPPTEAIAIMQKLAKAYAIPQYIINDVPYYQKWTRENSEKAGIAQGIHNELTARFLDCLYLGKDNPNAKRCNYHLTSIGRRALRGFLKGRYQTKTNNGG